MSYGKPHPANPGAENRYASEHDADNGPLEKGELGDPGVDRTAQERVVDKGPTKGTTTRDGQGNG